MTDTDKLIERLNDYTIETKGHPASPGGRRTGKVYRNPDGPEAATLLQSQQQIIGELREALLFYAEPENWHGVYMVGSGPMVDDWDNSWPDDQYPDGKPGGKARAALNKQESLG